MLLSCSVVYTLSTTIHNNNLILQSSFFYIYLACWNALHENVRQSSSLTSFEREINLFNLSKYLKGRAADIN